MIQRFFLLLLLILVLTVPAKAQQEYLFREGLAISNCHDYARKAVNTDLFVLHYFSEGFTSPLAGRSPFSDVDGSEAVWKEIKADSSGVFRDREASNGYICLRYDSPRARNVLVNFSGNAMFWFDGKPHAGDINHHGWLNVPVRLKKGMNEFYVRTSRIIFQGMKAKLIFPEKPVFLSTGDATLPFIVQGHDNASLTGAVVVVNATERRLTGLTIRSVFGGKEMVTDLPEVMPMSMRKVPFAFNGEGVAGKGLNSCALTLFSGGRELDEAAVNIESVNAGEPYSSTFVSNIDGSVQYYAVNPQKEGSGTKALFLSVHGAGVEAIGQARSYSSKDWGVLVAPTNRRPRGFNWEDWGRLDALEVLDHAVKRFNPDPSRIYLTGHSMGGHGTWFLGATYPGKWAAIAPCAGYPTLLGYGSADGIIPVPGDIEMEKTILRASNTSNTIRLAGNYAAGGVYVHHGDDDRTVSVDFARQMREILGTFHHDFCYYEYPGGSHWFGNESVDWPPLFNYFKWHTIKPDSAVNTIDFTTANPAVSSQYRWASVIMQQEPLEFSNIKLRRDRNKALITGETMNVSLLKLDCSGIESEFLTIGLDSDTLIFRQPGSGIVWLSKADRWSVAEAPDLSLKGPHRGGIFKEAFNNRMVFVYGTSGTKEENEWSLAKAAYDAEMWYYRANGAVDMVADSDFRPGDYPDRGIIIYGNATTNAAWKLMLSNCPVQVERGVVTVGGERITGGNFGAYIMYPRYDSNIASVAAVTGTGLIGMHAADANQYFTGGSGFPGYMIFSADMLREGVNKVIKAGYYTNKWELE
jgi:poly(3-hydroxybutyrate) depolymerase